MGAILSKNSKTRPFSNEQVWNIWIPNMFSIWIPLGVETRMLDFGICHHMVGQISQKPYLYSDVCHLNNDCSSVQAGILDHSTNRLLLLPFKYVQGNWSTKLVRYSNGRKSSDHWIVWISNAFRIPNTFVQYSNCKIQNGVKTI